MASSTKNAIIVALLMVGGVVMAATLKPDTALINSRPAVELETSIPQRFGEWVVDNNQHLAILNPQTEAVLDSIYDGTLARTYVNPKGDRVMLSIAYGSQQTDSLKAHTPDICYPAQGFSVTRKLKGEIHTNDGSIPVNRLLTVAGSRSEPVTYWIVVGDRIGRDSFDRKLIQLEYGLKGIIPDGILFRVSTIGGDEQAAFALQDSFVVDLLKAVAKEYRGRLAGLDG